MKLKVDGKTIIIQEDKIKVNKPNEFRAIYKSHYIDIWKDKDDEHFYAMVMHFDGGMAVDGYLKGEMHDVITECISNINYKPKQ